MRRKSAFLSITGLEVKAGIKASVGFLFGLGVCAFANNIIVTEVLMNNTIVNSCVWCGVAFLRSPSGVLSIQMRRQHFAEIHVDPRETREVRFLSSALVFQQIPIDYSVSIY